MPSLYLPLKREYFEQIKSGEKKFEYRRANKYWTLRLYKGLDIHPQGKDFDGIILTCGYPRQGDESRILRRPWRGFERHMILHPLFGLDPVNVYAIRVNE